MRTRFVAAFSGVLVGAIACSDQSQSAVGPLAGSDGPSLAVTRTVFPDQVVNFLNTCVVPNESGTVTGDAVLQTNLTVNGNHAHLKTSVKFHGTGEATNGVKYVAKIDQTQSQSVDTRDGFPIVQSAHATGQAISQGSGANFVNEGDVHITVNANGDVTSFRMDPLTITCRG